MPSTLYQFLQPHTKACYESIGYLAVKIDKELMTSAQESAPKQAIIQSISNKNKP